MLSTLQLGVVESTAGPREKPAEEAVAVVSCAAAAKTGILTSAALTFPVWVSLVLVEGGEGVHALRALPHI